MIFRGSQTPPLPSRWMLHTAGGLLPDNRILELIKAEVSDKPQLLLWRRGSARIASRHDVHGQIYAPAVLSASLLQVVFPPAPRPHGPVAKLFEAVKHLLECYGGLHDEYLDLATYFVFSTHFADVLSTAPFLLIAGDSDAPAAQLLRVLSVVCRRGILLSAVPPAPPLELMPIRPTVLLHQPNVNNSTARFVSATQHQSFNVLDARGVLRQAFFAKAVYAGGDAWKLPYTCTIPAASLQEQALLSDATRKQLAMQLQARLLDYRLRNLDQVRLSIFDASEFAQPMRQIATALGRCIVGNDKLQADIARVLRSQDEHARADRTISRESVVAEVLLASCHGPLDERTRVRNIAEMANAILRGRGEGFSFSPRQVGVAVKELGIVTKRDSHGYGFSLNANARRRIHERARALEVPGIKNSTPGCKYCLSATDTKPAAEDQSDEHGERDEHHQPN